MAEKKVLEKEEVQEKKDLNELVNTPSRKKSREHTFSKEQILGSEKYGNRRDLLHALLEDGRKYTMEEAEKKIEQFMKGTVN